MTPALSADKTRFESKKLHTENIRNYHFWSIYLQVFGTNTFNRRQG
ncbi:hypothetical protein F383_10540 [Gossypium arboreum]|uniref:Uncharacterized protein n=1 Tax=Gossypium arboreum TaxID=29729 RepID=A0A0B0NRT5_GOSAR|nr:hypothetical protein F383_04584 [Gossypium arboreum]KHG15337.1 hypothetical protein F383_10540 [Gossypium arboreum]